MKPIIAILLCFGTLTLFASNEPLLQSGSITNIGGWHVSLSAPTNPIVAGTNIVITLVISNASQATGYLGWSWSPDECPGFGRINITNRLSREHLPFCGKSWSWVDERGGGFGPTDSMSFKFDLTKNYCLRKSGAYEIGFRGNVRSLKNAGELLHFEMPPLLLVVEDPKLGTNAPPTDLKR